MKCLIGLIKDDMNLVMFKKKTKTNLKNKNKGQVYFSKILDT